MLLVVNYHYVHPEGAYPHPGIYPTPVERLAGQLEEIGRHFEFVAREDLAAALDGGRGLPTRACLVTFDDGLRDQYENALPVLERAGVRATFFVSGRPLAERRPLLVHQTHWLRAHLAPEELFARMDEALQAEGSRPLDALLAEAAEGERSSRYDEGAAARLRFAMRHVIPFDTGDRVMGLLFDGLVPDAADFCERFYMDEAMVRDLGRRGLLGLHSYDHRPLTRLDPGAVRRDLARNRNVLAGICGAPVDSLAYPYGGAREVSLAVAREGAALGLRLGFTMERAFNASLAEPHLLARFDTNDAPGGKSPLFRVEDGEIAGEGAFTRSRELFVREPA